MKPTLLRQYKPTDFDPSWLKFLINPYQTFNLSTEFVFSEPQICAPKQGRIYRTDLFAPNRQIRGRFLVADRSKIYDMHLRLHGREKFNGLHEVGEDVHMVEHYEDHGDDGHTDMRLTGYIFVRESDLKLVDHYGRKQFAYIEALWQQQLMASATKEPWKCDICGHSDCDSLHLGEGFQ
jgi:hypothetical protein